MLYLLLLTLGNVPEFVVENKCPTTFAVVNKTGEDADAAPTPHAEIARVLALLPKPSIAFVDYGCGPDARWCIAAAERWKCKAIGVEIDPARARAAKERVRSAGMSHLVTIVEGDATTTDVNADVGVAYLWPDVLSKLKPKLEKLTAFASYMHRPPGLPVTKNGDSWFYVRPQPVAQVPMAAWGGQLYTRPVCNDPRCGMCAAIRAQLQAAATAPPVVAPPPVKAAAKPRLYIVTADNCVPCKQLLAAIKADPDFTDALGGRELVEVNASRTPVAGVDSFPTAILTDAEGRTVGTFVGPTAGLLKEWLRK